MPGPAAILAGAKIASSLYGGFSGLSSGKKAAKEAKRAAEARAKELGIQADYEGELAIEQKTAQLDANTRRLSEVEGLYSKSGLLLTGTPAHAMDKQKETDEYNIEQSTKAADERVRRLRVQAQMEIESGEAQADAYKTQGKTDLYSGLFGAATAASPYAAAGFGKAFHCA